MMTPDDLGRLAFDTAAKWAGDSQIRFDEADDELRDGMTAVAIAVAAAVRVECANICGHLADGGGVGPFTSAARICQERILANITNQPAQDVRA